MRGEHPGARLRCCARHRDPPGPSSPSPRPCSQIISIKKHVHVPICKFNATPLRPVLHPHPYTSLKISFKMHLCRPPGESIPPLPGVIWLLGGGVGVRPIRGDPGLGGPRSVLGRILPLAPVGFLSPTSHCSAQGSRQAPCPPFTNIYLYTLISFVVVVIITATPQPFADPPSSPSPGISLIPSLLSITLISTMTSSAPLHNVYF